MIRPIGLAAVLISVLLVGVQLPVWEAQEPLDPASELRGRIVDRYGAAVPGLTVTVHRVTPDGGAEIARAESGPDGRFVLPLAADSAIYFAAVEYEGRLHVGEPFRGAPAGTSDYIVVVGADVTAFEPGRDAGPPAGGSGSLLVWVIVAMAAVGFMLFRWRRGRIDPRAERRACLLELAELEERRSSARVDADEYESERAALRGRLGIKARVA